MRGGERCNHGSRSGAAVSTTGNRGCSWQQAWGHCSTMQLSVVWHIHKQPFPLWTSGRDAPAQVLHGLQYIVVCSQDM